MEFIYQYLDLVDYDDAVQLMEEKIPEVVQQKKAFLFGLQHPRVYTRGLTFEESDLLDPDLPVVKARRGGSITVHNPGQLVFYTVLPLNEARGGLDGFIRYLEGSIIETLWRYGVIAFLQPPYTGVWTRRGKIAFIGLGSKKGAIFHGIAVNLVNDLGDYQPIFSCGLTLPITRYLDEPRLRTRPADEKQLLTDFSGQLSASLRARFSPEKPAAFRHAVLQRQVSFPEAHLAFRVGQLHFNERRYWEAHEAWEMFWHVTAPGPFRIFLQGMIQLSMALYKMTAKPNRRGALSLLAKCQEKLAGNPYLKKYLRTVEDQGALMEYISDLQKAVSETTSDDADLQALATPYLVATPYDVVG